MLDELRYNNLLYIGDEIRTPGQSVFSQSSDSESISSIPFDVFIDQYMDSSVRDNVIKPQLMYQNFKLSPKKLVIKDNKSLYPLSDSINNLIYNFQKGKKVSFAQRSSISFNSSRISFLLEKLSFEINSFFQYFTNNSLLTFTQNFTQNPFEPIIESFIGLPISSIIYNFLDKSKFYNRNTISDVFEYLNYKLLSDLSNGIFLTQEMYYKYLNEFKIIYIINFISQAIVTNILEIFLSDFENNMNLKKEIEIIFYQPKFIKNFNSIFSKNNLDSEYLRINRNYLEDMFKEHFHRILLCYFNIIDFQKIFETKEKVNKNNLKLLKSFSDFINLIDINITDDLIITLKFKNLYKLYKLQPLKISFKKKKI